MDGINHVAGNDFATYLVNSFERAQLVLEVSLRSEGATAVPYVVENTSGFSR
jgi:hypothetical protein